MNNECIEKYLNEINQILRSGQKKIFLLEQAIILSRLNGKDLSASVQTLSNTIDSFGKENLNPQSIINKLAQVDAKYAMSSSDLIDAINRCSASAEETKISFEELTELILETHKRTGRGGAVIGDSIKSIFNRLHRRETLLYLQFLGIEGIEKTSWYQQNVPGEMPKVTEQYYVPDDLLQQVAKIYPKLSGAKQEILNELLGGVFQRLTFLAVLDILIQKDKK